MNMVQGLREQKWNCFLRRVIELQHPTQKFGKTQESQAIFRNP